MKKERLSLETIEVKSFITTDEQNSLFGGVSEIEDPFTEVCTQGCSGAKTCLQTLTCQ